LRIQLDARDWDDPDNTLTFTTPDVGFGSCSFMGERENSSPQIQVEFSRRKSVDV
jgi:hypothetical protein